VKRTRVVNAAPARNASETVATISDVIAASLAAASEIDNDQVTAALSKARATLLMLVSSRRMKDSPVVLVAGNAICEFFCRYDAAAVGGEENLNPVPGMSTATTFMLHVPAPEPLAGPIAALVAGNKHLTTEPAPAAAPTAARAAGSSPIDLTAIKELL
jgi:hypothetical protein